MQLWKVSGYVHVVIACDGFPLESEIDDAVLEATANMRGLHTGDVVEITAMSDLPEGWYKVSVPYGDGPAHATIADMLGAGEEEA